MRAISSQFLAAITTGTVQRKTHCLTNLAKGTIFAEPLAGDDKRHALVGGVERNRFRCNSYECATLL